MTDLRSLPDVLAASDTSRPVVTCYDRMPGPTEGERIEISARVLLTWAAKAAGALGDEFLVEPGQRVGLALPPHWRLGYWAIATWWLGATLVTGPEARSADVLVSDDVELLQEHGGDGVLVTLAALARRSPLQVPSGVLDEAQELSSFPDRFTPVARPAADDTAWEGGTLRLAYGAPVPPADGRVCAVARPDETEACLRLMTELWTAGGSLVLVRATDTPSDISRVTVTERASLVESLA